MDRKHRGCQEFWVKVFSDLKTRGVGDILIAVTDGFKGMPEALAAVFPATTLQTCIVRLIRNSLDYASWKYRRALACCDSTDLHSPERRGRTSRARCVCRRPLGAAIPDGVRRLAQRLGSRNSILCVPAGRTQGDLHDERH
ncbi:probable transposase protein [Ralstonia solanacearum IPO1609]|uniref:Mutator family transposase n=1 Tax=Ralstonia solanacearum IPO1609 TaxID=564066 RepID=A0A7U7JCQ5_RALSL|nr:probable transposase protein [Ralstonia solanacearum IPO1609]